MGRRYREKHLGQINTRMMELADKYYHTRDLSLLTPHQLDKVTGWAMNWTPDKGKTKQRKAEQALRSKRSGHKKYPNSRDKTQAITKKNKYSV